MPSFRKSSKNFKPPSNEVKNPTKMNNFVTRPGSSTTSKRQPNTTKNSSTLAGTTSARFNTRTRLPSGTGRSLRQSLEIIKEGGNKKKFPRL